ncbi:hypothetical protein [[Mycobacterium] crassicus]|uniref:Uncharacterized protein n=1 Tax=[Mycobacterium] crassicus TaxID=2872309 RepID=A0ABU5XGK0_9MYCO|nr:hypothetical protein [Mycolicibacter sp. MYC098]MEB3021283.1 hypothetical protein [Mycolicibacter sp. MYC098]
MVDQLELFAQPAATPPPRFDADQTLRGLPHNIQGTCCGHWRAQHDNPGGCRFCPCQKFSDAPTEPPCCRTGVTGHCVHGRHDQCPYSPGGGCYGGIIRSECYVLMPPTGGWPGTDPLPTPGLGYGILVDADAAVYGRCDILEVIEPTHRIVCGCDCHAPAPTAATDRCAECPHTRADHGDTWCDAVAQRTVGDTTRAGACLCRGFASKRGAR